MTKVKNKEELVKEIEKMRDEGIIYFSTPQLMERLGFHKQTRSRVIRNYLHNLEQDGMIEIVKINRFNIYIIKSNLKVNVPFFEKPLAPPQVQKFLDRFYNDISKLLIQEVGDNQFSLYFNGGSIYYKKIHRDRL